MEKLQPKLRFPEFVGNWGKFKLDEVSVITTGSTPDTTEDKFYNGDILFISPFDINGQRYISESRTSITELGLKKVREIKEGSVLFVCIGSTIGKVGQVVKKSATNQQINSLFAKKDNCNNYLYSLLEKQGTKIRLLAGTQAVPQINKSDFSKLSFFFPKLEEQQKIAQFLTQVDTKINQLTKKQSLLEQYKKGIMQKIFNQEIRFKDDDGNDYPEWEDKTLGEVCDLFHGYQFRSTDFTKEGLAIVKISNVIGSELNLKELTFIDENRYPEFKKFEIQNGDILMSLTGNIGRVIEVKDKSMVLIQNYRVGKFCPYDENILSKPFLKYLLISDLVFGRFNQLSNQSAQANFGKQDMDKISIMNPTLKEQTKIANFLSAIDDKINQVNTQLEKTKEFKKGLLQQMFV